MKDFFISYTHTDKAWAEWIAWQLEEENYSTILQEWDFLPGTNFINKMQKASVESKTTIAVISAKYLDALFTLTEWAAAFASDPAGDSRRLIPIKIKPCTLEGLLSQVVYIDLAGKNEAEAKAELLKGVSAERKKPEIPPAFPESAQPETYSKRPFPIHQKSVQSTWGLSKRFVHTQITTGEFFNFDNFPNPYSHLYDPTDPPDSIDIAQIFCYLWLPRSEYLKSSRLQPQTAVTAICCVEPYMILECLKKYADIQIFEKLEIPPSKLRPQYKETCIDAINLVLPLSFVFSIAVPDMMLKAGRSKLDFAYQIIINLFLRPLIEMHKKIGFEEFRLQISETGENKPYLLSSIKNILKAYFPKKGSFSVEFVSASSSDRIFSHMARFLAWIVGTYYNSHNSRWISKLESKQGRSGSSHLEEPD